MDGQKQQRCFAEHNREDENTKNTIRKIKNTSENIKNRIGKSQT